MKLVEDYGLSARLKVCIFECANDIWCKTHLKRPHHIVYRSKKAANMYYDEEYYNQMDYDDCDDFSTKSNIRKVKKIIEDTSDKNVHKIKLANKKTITVHSSGDIGSHIRNAVTGRYYGKNHVVGSSIEDLYFRVGHNVGSEMKKLFFDSPDQYEKHFSCNVEKDVSNGLNIKRSWAQRAMAHKQEESLKPAPSQNTIIR